MRSCPVLASLVVASLVLVCPSVAAADEALWALMRGGGQVIFMRHAVTTPGVGDPAGFRLDDCSTQRNLTTRDATTRAALGPRSGRAPFRSAACSRAHGVAASRPRGSPSAPRRPGRLSAISSTIARARRSRCALSEIAGRPPAGGNVVLVTHGSVVLPLTGIQPAPAELVVLTPEGFGRFRVAGRLTP